MLQGSHLLLSFPHCYNIPHGGWFTPFFVNTHSCIMEDIPHDGWFTPFFVNTHSCIMEDIPHDGWFTPFFVNTHSCIYGGRRHSEQWGKYKLLWNMDSFSVSNDGLQQIKTAMKG